MPSAHTVKLESGSHENASASEAREPGKSDSLTPELGEAVRQELKRILYSRYFKTAGRSRQFLQFVVDHRLAGHSDQLKERTIGTEVFQRPLGYATGDDPVVRVQAGEVRRRLEQFYQHEGTGSTVKIDLPVGSYCPQFHWNSQIADNEIANPSEFTPATPSAQPVRSRFSFRSAYAGGIITVALVLLLSTPFVLHRTQQRGAFEQFWAPVFNSPQPALICLAKGVTYRPSADLYDKYRSTHPGKFQTEVEKSSDPLPLDPNQSLQWRDLRLFSDYGVATGDVYAAIRISGALGQLRKPAQLRIGTDSSFQDLRNSPGVIVGAFNNKWTMKLTSNLRFAFVEDETGFLIREQVPNGRTWPLPTEGDQVPPAPVNNLELAPQAFDYAIVGRLMDSKTGQFTIIAAGLAGAGTEAAGEFVSSPDLLEKALRTAPVSWQKTNSLFVLKTAVTDSVAGPPTVVASYYW